MSYTDEYLKTLDKLEPDIVSIDAATYYASAAISLKRIADSLEKLTNGYENYLSSRYNLGMEKLKND